MHNPKLRLTNYNVYCAILLVDLLIAISKRKNGIKMKTINIILVLIVLIPKVVFSQFEIDTNECTWNNSYPLHYLDKITCKNDFDALQKTQFKLNHTLHSVKVVFNINQKKLYI